MLTENSTKILVKLKQIKEEFYNYILTNKNQGMAKYEEISLKKYTQVII